MYEQRDVNVLINFRIYDLDYYYTKNDDEMKNAIENDIKEALEQTDFRMLSVDNIEFL